MVREQFSLPYIYYAGTHYRCGCGFLKEGEEGADLQLCHANYIALAQCCNAAFSCGARIQLFSCWEGDQKETPVHVSRVTPSTLTALAFELRGRQLLHVYQDV